MTNDTRRIQPKPDVLMQTVGDEAVLLNLATEQYIGLNPVAARMWSALAGAEDVASALTILQEQYEVDAAVLRRDLHRFIDQLQEQKLVDVT